MCEKYSTLLITNREEFDVFRSHRTNIYYNGPLIKRRGADTAAYEPVTSPIESKQRVGVAMFMLMQARDVTDDI